MAWEFVHVVALTDQILVPFEQEAGSLMVISLDNDTNYVGKARYVARRLIVGCRERHLPFWIALEADPAVRALNPEEIVALMEGVRLPAAVEILNDQRVYVVVARDVILGQSVYEYRAPLVPVHT